MIALFELELSVSVVSVWFCLFLDFAELEFDVVFVKRADNEAFGDIAGSEATRLRSPENQNKLQM